MGFLGTSAGISADINLILQIAIICFLIVGRSKAKRKNFIQHGQYMALVVALNTVAFTTVMLPSLLFGVGFIIAYPFNLLSIIFVFHSALGVISLLLGYYLVLKWRFNKPLVECLKNRILMRPTIILWVATAIIGILLYLELYVLIGAG